MALTAVCDSCGIILQPPDWLSGRKVKCKECGSPVQLPGDAAVEGDPESAATRPPISEPPDTELIDVVPIEMLSDAAKADAAKADAGSPDAGSPDAAAVEDAAAMIAAKLIEAALSDTAADKAGARDESTNEPKPQRMPPRVESPRPGRPIRSRAADDDSRGWPAAGFSISPLFVPLLSFVLCFAGSFLWADGPVTSERLRHVFLASMYFNIVAAWIGSVRIIHHDDPIGAFLAVLFPLGGLLHALSNFDEHGGWLGLAFVSSLVAGGMTLGEIQRENAERAARNQPAPVAAPDDAPDDPFANPIQAPQQVPEGDEPNQNADQALRPFDRRPNPKVPVFRVERGRPEDVAPPAGANQGGNGPRMAPNF